MKTKILTFGVLLMLLTSNSLCQSYFDSNKTDKSRTTLIVTHPTTSNLSIVLYLIEHKLLDISNYELVGVYYDNEDYDYSATVKFLKDGKYKNVFLHKLDSGLRVDNLFKDNPLSGEFRKVFENSDGVIFFGGPDLPAEVYNQKTSLLTEITDPHRHYFELSLLVHLLGGSQNEAYKPLLDENPDYMIFGICLGMQTMNAATGGTMYQDIPTEVYNINYVEDILALEPDLQHRNYWTNLSIEELSWGKFHKIKFQPNSFFVDNLKLDEAAQPLVYSSHHQAVRGMGKGFEVAATSLDGKIVEAISHTKYPNVFGVQFHPERTGLYNHDEQFRFSPKDKPFSYLSIIEPNGLEFHRNLWKYISKILQNK